MELPARIALNEQCQIEAVGKYVDEAVADQCLDGQRITIYEPFNDPEMLVSNATAAERLLYHVEARYLIEAGSSLFMTHLLRRVRIILHPVEKSKAGLTEVEAQTLLALGSRGLYRRAQAYVWVGRELWKDEVESLRFPAEGNLYTGNARLHPR